MSTGRQLSRPPGSRAQRLEQPDLAGRVIPCLSSRLTAPATLTCVQGCNGSPLRAVLRQTPHISRLCTHASWVSAVLKLQLGMTVRCAETAACVQATAQVRRRLAELELDMDRQQGWVRGGSKAEVRPLVMPCTSGQSLYTDEGSVD